MGIPSLKRIFDLTYPSPLAVRVRSRQACIYLNRTIKFVGWRPPKQGSKRYIYLILTCWVFASCIIYLPIGFVLSFVVGFGSFTLGELLGLLQISISIIGTSAKSIAVFTLISKLGKTESKLDELDQMLQSESDRWKIHKAVARCNNAFLSYGKVYTLYGISICVAAILTGQLPWMIYNPLFDWRDGTLNYFMQTILEYFAVGMIVALTLVDDAYSIVFVMIFRAHIDVLKDHIRKLRTEPSKTEAGNYEDLVRCIVYYKLIRKCCYQISPVITRTIFVQFLLIGVILGMTLVNLKHFQDIFHLASSIIYLNGILVETFPFCYQCDSLIKDCEELSDLLAQSHWIDAQPRYKSTLRTFLHHLQQPIVFIAGGIFPITMHSNIRVAKFAFSVITVVERKNLLDRFK